MNTRSIKAGEKVARNAIVRLLLMGSLKLAAGLVTGMTVIIVDAVSTFTDTIGIFASYIGLRLSRKAANNKFEYGYYKVETFMALLISIGIIYLGYQFIISSIDILQNPEEGHFRTFAITTTLLAIHQSYSLYTKLKEAGEKVNSLALIAAAKDKQMDMFASLAILVSIIANYKGIPYVEGIVALAIALIILKVGITTAKESLFFLLDYWNDPVLANKIRKVLRDKIEIVQSIKKLRLRRAGTFIFGEAFVEINPFADIQDLRDDLEILQNKVREISPYIKDFIIYTHIAKSETLKIGIPVRNDKGISSDVANNLKQTTHYLFADIKAGKTKKHYLKKLERGDKTLNNLGNFLKAEKVNILVDNQLNSLIYYNLRKTHHIVIYPNFSDTKTAEQAIKMLLIDT
jgi:cation diffusion facilitator family transporter